jgi:REP element-mobilizing transposase RayT
MNDEPLAFFLTWTTYGSWLPGDERGWVKWHDGFQQPNERIRKAAAAKMVEAEIALDTEQRNIVEQTVTRHCEIRGWYLHAVNCRTNHVHVVVTAANYDPETVRDQFKSWCTRKLKERERQKGCNEDVMRQHWWTEGGSQRSIDDEDSLEAAIEYVLDAQDTPPESKRG